MAGLARLHHRAGSPAHGRQRGLEERGLGRSRGGLTSKVHLACDRLARPLAFVVTAGNRDDCTQAEAVIARISVAGGGPGRPRVRPERVVADKAYSAGTLRAYLRKRGIKATIPDSLTHVPLTKIRTSYGPTQPGTRRFSSSSQVRSKIKRVPPADEEHAGWPFAGLLLARNAATSASVRNLAVEGGMVQPYSATRG
ncbi:transposase [Streptomyces sp. RS2]|uniref:transposase n=1 Tax=Streptomyces sp. RS2 TaxID=1451205 RepID=UPI0035A904D5